MHGAHAPNGRTQCVRRPLLQPRSRIEWAVRAASHCLAGVRLLGKGSGPRHVKQNDCVNTTNPVYIATCCIIGSICFDIGGRNETLPSATVCDLGAPMRCGRCARACNAPRDRAFAPLSGGRKGGAPQKCAGDPVPSSGRGSRNPSSPGARVPKRHPVAQLNVAVATPGRPVGLH